MSIRALGTQAIGTQIPTKLDHLRIEYGLDALDVKESLDHVKVMKMDDGQERHFLYYIATWRKGDRRYRILLEPKLKGEDFGFWPFQGRRYKVDDDVMMRVLVKAIKTSLKKAQDV